MGTQYVSFPGLGIYSLPIDRVAFSFNLGDQKINIYWYGLIIAAAFLVCFLLAVKQAPKYGIKSDHIVDTALLIMILAIIGARLYYVIFSWDEFSDDLMRIFQTRHGGLAFYGGLIGGIIALVIITKRKKINLIHLADFLAVYVPLGHAIGRWGNFFNQEAFGTNTDLPWGMYSEQTYQYLSQYGDKYAPLSPVHPTFLYESIANILIFIILYQIRKNSKKRGETLAWYFILYGIVRFGIEGLRTDSLFIGNTTIRASQALSLLFVILGVIVLVYISRRKQVKDLAEAGEIMDPETSETEFKSDFVLLNALDSSNEDRTIDETTEIDK
ncbi:MAG: prolipoprotein diacylglyceryl transferase [Clostridiaceae bacterium]|nr:prolipoprotein diacylglyceryl transferase [Clostridiaceae bacterium]